MRCLLVLFAFLAAIPLTAKMPLYTVDIVERAVVAVAESVCAVAGPVPSFVVVDHPDAAWVESIVLGLRPDAACLSVRSPDPAAAEIILTINDISTRYELADDADSIRRSVVVAITARERRTGKQLAAVRTVHGQETLPRERATALESRQHTGTSAPMPPHPTTFWEDIAQPVIFIAAAATTIILLFTVRSQ